MENKQLQRELNNIIHNLMGTQINTLFAHFQSLTGISANIAYNKSSINCNCCTITYDLFTTTGYGRNDQEALVNAARNMFETFNASAYQIQTFKRALKMMGQKNALKPIQQLSSAKANSKKDNQNINKHQQTLDLSIAEAELNQIRGMQDVSRIVEPDQQKRNLQTNKQAQKIYNCKSEAGGCGCVYYQIHQYQVSQIKNLQARMRLIAKQNQMLKQLLLKDNTHHSIFKNNKESDKQNSLIKSNLKETHHLDPLK